MRSLIIILLSIVAVFAQRSTGELRFKITDKAGNPLDASAHLVGLATQLDRTIPAVDGHAIASQLPFGVYRATIQKAGFAADERLIEVRSEVPDEIAITLDVAPVKSMVTVSEDDTLLNTERAGLVQYIGNDNLKHRRSALPARGMLEMVDLQPGWLLEANGVLHPRGSEYDVQYVVDGIPLFDNRSPAFVPGLSVNDTDSLNVLTGGYPAEYGRKLGGVVEVTSSRDPRQGVHGNVSLQGGSFDTMMAFANLQYTKGRSLFAVNGDGLHTKRYLDPPVTNNFTNKGSGGGFGARFERDLSDDDRLRFAFRDRRVGFLVPNDRIQEAVGQRQDRTAGETLGQASWQHVISPTKLLNVRGMGREVDADLWSNSLSIPIAPTQNRGFREGYLNATLSWRAGSHELKFGGEGIYTSVRERFDYRITAYRVQGFRIFDGDTPGYYAFNQRGIGRQTGGFAQDQWRWRNLVVNYGVRWDYYNLAGVEENAWSPRVAAAWSFPSIGLTVRGSYDRAFQTPAIENILLASSSSVAEQVGEEGFQLPVRPARAHFFEGGFSKTLGSRLRLDGSVFRRNFRNFFDDEVLLNTGISFPISFDRAAIDGVEAKLEMPRWGRFNGFLSYSNLNARAHLPITGGLFLDEDDGEMLTANGQFRISQDQRNTVRTRWRAEVTRRVWVAAFGQYGSGLPVELEDTNTALWRLQYGQEVLNRVNFARERVRPNLSIDLSAGVQLIDRERLRMMLQGDVYNITNRLNVINFAGLLSGTALQQPRSAMVRIDMQF